MTVPVGYKNGGHSHAGPIAGGTIGGIADAGQEPVTSSVPGTATSLVRPNVRSRATPVPLVCAHVHSLFFFDP